MCDKHATSNMKKTLFSPITPLMSLLEIDMLERKSISDQVH